MDILRGSAPREAVVETESPTSEPEIMQVEIIQSL